MNKLAVVAAISVALLQPCFSRESAIKVDEVEEVHAFIDRGSLVVRNRDGRIHLYGSDSTELKVIATRRAFSEERAQAIRIDVRIEGDIAMIDTHYPPPEEGIAGDRSGTVDYAIYLPQHTSVALAELQNGEMLLDGLRGDSAQARVVNGRLLARNCFTELTVSVARGGMDLFYMWWEDENFSLDARIDNGHVRLGLPPDTAAVLDLETQQGHIRSQFDKKKPADADARQRRITVGGDSEIELKVRTGNGNIRVERSY
jgi:hypothetical protein